MPSVFELLQDPIAQSVMGIYLALIGLEALFPGRPLPRVKGWWWLGLGSFAVYFLLSSYLPLLWTDWLLQWQLFDLSGLGTGWGAVLGLLLARPLAAKLAGPRLQQLFALVGIGAALLLAGNALLG